MTPKDVLVVYTREATEQFIVELSHVVFQTLYKTQQNTLIDVRRVCIIQSWLKLLDYWHEAIPHSVSSVFKIALICPLTCIVTIF